MQQILSCWTRPPLLLDCEKPCAWARWACSEGNTGVCDCWGSRWAAGGFEEVRRRKGDPGLVLALRTLLVISSKSAESFVWQNLARLAKGPTGWTRQRRRIAAQSTLAKAPRHRTNEKMKLKRWLQAGLSPKHGPLFVVDIAAPRAPPSVSPTAPHRLVAVRSLLLLRGRLRRLGVRAVLRPVFG